VNCALFCPPPYPEQPGGGIVVLYDR